MSPRPDPTETRAALLDAALHCFQRTGYHRTSMDDVVRESGLSKGTLYWHFTNKQDLFLTLFDETIEQIMGLFEQPDPALPAAAQLETLLA
ncbi:MAG TPA: helix-turn-helix domain-containing protein, partial [Phototrophicaceae bacterium]|nr:helix-turn-helix domain-containing protein [Phototrophicaceae bacterium]